MTPAPLKTLSPVDSGEPPPSTLNNILYEEVLERCCGTGRWQMLHVGYMSIMWFIFPTFAISMMFVGATPEFRCADGFDANATFASLPADTPQCHRINDTNSSCTRWVFDTSVYLSTVVTEWSLVCGRKPLLSMLQSWVMIGAIIGSVVGGQLSDRFGRRPVFLPTMVLMFACSLSAALVGDYASFAVVRCVTGFAIACMSVSQFTLVTELSNGKHRAMLATMIFLPYAFGIMFVTACSYAIRTRWLLQLALTTPCLLFLPNFWVMPESPRWLVVQGRFAEACKVLRQGARWNRRQMPSDDEVLKLMAEVRRGLQAREEALKGTGSTSMLQLALDLVRTKRMCIRSLASLYIGFAVSGAYYGISFDITQLSESPHLAAVLSGLVEIPSYLTFPLMNRFGRRRSMLVFLFIPAACMFLVFAKKDATFWLVLGLTAKLGVTASFSMIGSFVSELMPTRQRGLALGALNMSHRVAAALSPFVVDLVSELHELAPSAVFGTVVLLANLATLLLPETVGQPMPETVADVETAEHRNSAAAPSNDQRGISNDALQLEDVMPN